VETKDWAGIIVQAIIAISTLVAAWPLIKRARSQNNRDDVEATKVALELAGIGADEQLKLKKEVGRLTKMLEKQRYRISVTFRLGERPHIEEATIESYEVATM
jgi:HAMP domain-containing protein